MRKNRRQHRDLKVEFESRFVVDEATCCWNWTGNKFKRGGYGCFTCRPLDMFMQRAHRVSWALYCSPITEDQHVLHTCDNRLCVNPNHLFLGDQSANMEDKVIKGRQNRGETHGMVKLSEDQAMSIIADRRFQSEIAADYGISVITVSNIKTGRSWKHLDRSKLHLRVRGDHTA